MASRIDRAAEAIPDIHAPQPGHGIEVLRTVRVHDRGVVSAGDDELLSLQLLVLDNGVQDVAEIPLNDRTARRAVGFIPVRSRNGRTELATVAAEQMQALAYCSDTSTGT
jgi:hypothetical protein